MWVVIPFATLSLICTPAVSHLACGSLEWHYRPTYERPDDAEAIVVLAGSLRPPDDVQTEAELGDSTIGRCLHAARLYHRGRRCPIVVSGWKPHPGIPGPSLAELMREFLIRNGVAEGDVLMENRSQTTYENAVETGNLLRDRGIGKVVLVTDAMHLPRALGCFRAQDVDVVPSGCRFQATRFKWSVFTFLPRTGAAEKFQQAAHEWLGLAWYRLHGRN